ncbi:hypothetical protein [Metabacillus malikii]|uniref:Glucan phosphoethanolaminetransferase (Alkaline phosphatase superfamily) n=1 Tax=Metabacillus malikii TaxID=1504265 RepID=A0ABT9ZC73_9BACI|nr:hypothetical protein [Metabacillus malikii]MDQ0229857.1 glucan phosphoethanolaminetransferase (alkaline phosphatase superfamily) [Metabacillus malikii]
MYTYESFVTDGAFSLLRPILVTLLISSILLFIIILFPVTRRRFLHGFTMVSLSLVIAIVTIQTVFYSAIIADELGLGGDHVVTIMGGSIIVLQIVNVFLYFMLKKSKK